MSKEIQVANPFVLTTFAEAEKMANMIANSSLCPPGLKGKGGDVFIAIMMGSEVGLSPMQAIQNIAVINQRPCLYGDGALAVVRAHPHCQSVREWIEGTIEAENVTAFCGVTRKGQQEEIRSFSILDAKKAGLYGKTGPWSQYPLRMLQMRARGFAIRDTFPDALRGLNIAEEAQDIPLPEPAYVPPGIVKQQEEGLPLSLSYNVDTDELSNHLDVIKHTTTLDALKDAYMRAMSFAKGDKQAVNDIAEAKNIRKVEIEKADLEKDIEQ